MMIASPSGASSGPMSLRSTPASRSFALAARSIATMPPREVPTTTTRVEPEMVEELDHVARLDGDVVVA